MSRLLVFLFLANAVQFGAASPSLLVAIRNGDHSLTEKLLRAGADVNTVDSDGTTALMHSVIESDVKMMKLLIDSGANVNTKNGLDSTALMYAATNLAKTRLLLDRGAEVKARGKRGATPMSVGVTTFGSTPVLKLLAAGGAEPEDRLMALAAAKGDLEAIQFLLGLGVRPGDSTGATLSGGRTRRDRAPEIPPLACRGRASADRRSDAIEVLSSRERGKRARGADHRRPGSLAGLATRRDPARGFRGGVARIRLRSQRRRVRSDVRGPGCHRIGIAGPRRARLAQALLQADAREQRSHPGSGDDPEDPACDGNPESGDGQPGRHLAARARREAAVILRPLTPRPRHPSPSATVDTLRAIAARPIVTARAPGGP